MPKNLKINSILLIGSGPIQIGQACEFDYSGTQAIKALKAEGYRVILVNSNPATIMTDPDLSDRVYIEPLTTDFLEKVIDRERPDALLPTMGGQTALNLTVELAEKGILEKYGVQLLGASLESIKLAEDRDLFKKKMLELKLDIPKSFLVQRTDQLQEALALVKLPAIFRPSFTLGGEGGGIARTEEEFKTLLFRGLELSPVQSVLVEESLIGWKEYELEVVRDKADNVIIVCSIENVDPMGVHTGDSITVAPAQTLTNNQFQKMRDAAKKIIRAINVETGGSNIQFAVKPTGKDAGRMIVIEMNPRVSRSSALASKATGFPIAKVAAKLAVGYTLDELKNEITGTTPASFEPSIDYVVTKIPRFDFEKFLRSSPLLGTQMKSVGEVMAIGKTFKESFLKSLQSLENKWAEFGITDYDRDPSLTNDALLTELSLPSWTRIWYTISALRRNIPIHTLHETTFYDPWFLAQLKEIVDFEKHLSEKSFETWTERELSLAKQMGFSDLRLSQLAQVTEKKILEKRESFKIHPTYSQVDTCAGEFYAETPYLYSTYGTKAGFHQDSQNKSVLIIGSGPNRIGQGIEFDYACVHASQAAQELGYDSIMMNCNPETVSTDYDVSTRLYFEPLTHEKLSELKRVEKNMIGAIVQFGGQTPLKLAKQFKENEIPVLGTSTESIDLAEDRKRFEELLGKLASFGIKQPQSKSVFTKYEALQACKEIGYPILIRPSYVLGGRGMKIVFSDESLLSFIDEAIEFSDKHPVLIDQYLQNAVEVDVDAISDGTDVLVAGILEHIEEAGIHSGDSACSIPCFTLSPEIILRLREQTKKLAKELHTRGLINIQFAIYNQEIYVLEVNPRASRTIPFTAKAIGYPFAKIATKVMLGSSLKDLGYTEDFDLNLSHYNVKMPVFPFHKFPGVDVKLGPEMKSTGEVMGRAKDFSKAYAKALLGAKIKIPSTGTAFLSIADKDKLNAVEVATKLIQLGFKIEATEGTYRFLRDHQISCTSVAKVSNGTPHCVDHIHQGRYQLVINTSHQEESMVDGYAVRRAALERQIPYCTLITTSRVFLRAIEVIKSPLDVEPIRSFEA